MLSDRIGKIEKARQYSLEANGSPSLTITFSYEAIMETYIARVRDDWYAPATTIVATSGAPILWHSSGIRVPVPA